MISLRLDRSLRRRRVVRGGQMNLKWLNQRAGLPFPFVPLRLCGRRCCHGSGCRAIDEVGCV